MNLLRALCGQSVLLNGLGETYSRAFKYRVLKLIVKKTGLQALNLKAQSRIDNSHH